MGRRIQQEEGMGQSGSGKEHDHRENIEKHGQNGLGMSGIVIFGNENIAPNNAEKNAKAMR